MAIIFEDSAKVTKKKIPIPQRTKEMFKAMKKIYEPFLDKNLPGSKVLKSLGSDKKYNKKGVNSKDNGQEIKQDSVSVDDAKMRLHRMNKLPKNSIGYQLNGGEAAANLYRKGIEQARGVSKVDAVKPPKPTANTQVKPSDANVKSFHEHKSVPHGKKLLKEDVQDFYELMSEYDEGYVFNSFLEDKDRIPEKKQDWGVLINPNMYAKALREFTQYGQLTRFPTKYVYQWMGIIMRNTCILVANTNIGGHGDAYSFPSSEFEDFVRSYYNDDRWVEVDDITLKVEMKPSELINICDDRLIFIDEAVDKYGQTYFPWMTQDEIDKNIERADYEAKMKRFTEKYGDLQKYVDAYNKKNSNQYTENSFEIDETNDRLIWTVDAFVFLDMIGFMDWLELPDGSQGFSDFGIKPLLKVIDEYDNSLSPEKVLVLVNKALDVYHYRGDLSSIFIQGGTKSLNALAEDIKKNSRKVYITEAQLLNLRKWQRK